VLGLEYLFGLLEATALASVMCKGVISLVRYGVLQGVHASVYMPYSHGRNALLLALAF
jgi:hypothetical protein